MLLSESFMDQCKTVIIYVNDNLSLFHSCFSSVSFRFLWLQTIQINYGKGTEGKEKQKGSQEGEESQFTSIVAKIEKG